MNRRPFLGLPNKPTRDSDADRLQRLTQPAIILTNAKIEYYIRYKGI